MEKWAKENGLGINPEKSKSFVIGKKQISTLSLQKLFINQCDVLASILHVKSDPVGLDNISPKFVKHLLPLMLPHVTYIFNTAITTSS